MTPAGTSRTMEWHKQKDDPPEIADELGYKCGDPATEKELKGSYFPNKNAAQFLNTLLQPLVVSLPGHMRPCRVDVLCYVLLYILDTHEEIQSL